MVQQTIPSFRWSNPTKVRFGVGELASLREEVDAVAGTSARIFLVTGRHSLRSRGVLQRVLDALGESRVTLFDQATPFPPPDLVDTALDRCRAASCDIVVAVGGGSAMDLAKAVAVLAAHDGKCVEYAEGRKSIERAGLPFIAVPTTSGSSSEVTSGAALWDMEAKRSMGLGSPFMFPTVAIVDPELATSMPKTLAAVTGMDAFTSAFESYWSLDAEPIADAIDLEVVRIFATNLERSSIQGDLESRASCALGATMSGIAYSNSHPNVCHAVGSPLTLFWGASHGQAVGITLSAFLGWNASAIPHKLPALWDALGVEGLEEAVRRITQIMERCGLHTKLRGLGVSAADMETLIEHIRWDRLGVLPRPIDRDEMRGLLEPLL
ncbi:MAG: iron-containing alcohol dehydrogenase [Chloroflexi bacterium]|nr:iron-containing alcohol dehydrogenase [Chloroflexota bacterium]